jgi:hypothetical protein
MSSKKDNFVVQSSTSCFDDNKNPDSEKSESPPDRITGKSRQEECYDT